MADPNGNATPADAVHDTGELDEAELRARASSGVRWLMYGRMAIQLVSLGYAMALARLLTPEEFGVYGLAFVVLQLGTFIDGLRVESAVVQLHRADDAALSSAAVIGFLFGTVVVGLVWLLAPQLAVALDADGIVVTILRVMVAVFFVRGLFLVNRALLRRRLLFRRQVLVDLAKVSLSGALAVYAAAQGFGVWSLVVYYVARTVIEAVGTVIAAPWVPASYPNSRATRDLLRFGLPASASEVLVYAQLNLGDLFIGRVHGAAPLGYYQQAFGLMNKPTAYFDEVMRRLALPVLSRKWHSGGELGSAFSQAVSVVTAAAAPAACAVALLAPELVRVFYGPQWEAAIPLLQILAPLGLLKVWQPLFSAVFQAQGRPAVEMAINLATVLVLSVLLVFAVGEPPSRAAASVVIAAAFYAVACQIVLLAWTGVGPLGFLKKFVAPAVGCLGMVGVVLALRPFLDSASDVASGAVLGVTVLVVYTILLRVLDPDLFQQALRWAFRRA